MMIPLHDRQLPDKPCRLVVALGNFDGVHMAHQLLLLRAARLARALSSPGEPVYSAVFCFDPPSGTFLGSVTSLLSTREEKLAAFARCGIDYAYLADFPSLRDLPPDEFIASVLKKTLNTCHVVCGFHFRFGRGGAGNADTLRTAFGSSCVDVIPPICLPMNGKQTTISASAIRAALTEGNVPVATRLLGSPYSLSAAVVEGKRLGRTLGFPTINQNISNEKLLPKTGIYITRCYVDDDVFYGVTNVGHRPTVDGENARPNCETHLLGVACDLYGKTVRIEFLRRLRDEKRFASVRDLSAAVAQDIAAAKQYFHLK